MATLRKPLLALLIGLAMTLGLASCGESENAELLPGRTASEISANLDEVRRLAGEGDCIGAQDAALEVSDQVEALGGVDAELKAALREGAARLNEVVATCEEEAAEEEEEAEPELSTEPEEEEEEKPDKKAKPEKQSEAPGQEKKAEKEAAEPKEDAPEPPTTAEPPVEPPAGGTPSGGVGPSAPAGEDGDDG
ncbi:MAG TPA: hypothetical protein VK889_00335 [Solirubrobacterales bacterium]|nr:hypothetical protein [Solirubrobacterales bacterium]